MDFGLELLKILPAVYPTAIFGISASNGPWTLWTTNHRTSILPSCRLQIKDWMNWSNSFASVREAVGYEVPLASDHYGHFDSNNAIRLGKRWKNIAWPGWKIWSPGDLPPAQEIKQSIETPLCTGWRHLFMKEEFAKLSDNQAVDIMHPWSRDLRRVYLNKTYWRLCRRKGVAMACIFPAAPVSFMANVHCAAATQNFVALENHSIDVPYWSSLVKTVDGKPLYENGFANVPDTPGSQCDAQWRKLKKHLAPENTTFFAPTPGGIM